MKMKSNYCIVLMMIALSSILMVESLSSLSNVANNIHVFGKVLCQDCTQGWNEWVHGAKPIKGSVVSITCKDERKRVMYYGSDLTDENGDFDLIVNNTCYGKPLKPQSCFVRLVSSSDSVCNIPTDFGGGKSGVILRRPTVVYRGLVKYGLEPFYYTTPMCDLPDTDNSDNDNDNDNDNYDDKEKQSNY